MVDVRRPATLRGFPVSIADVGDQVHLCHPLLSFEGDPALYLTHRLDWRNDPEALAIADPEEASSLGTLLPPTCARPIASGEGLVVVGAGLVQAAATTGVELLDSKIPFSRVDDSECWIGVATPAVYTALRIRLANEARAAFDEELKDAAHRGSRLSERGDAALLLMRKCGTLRRDDLAIRQLAGARQNREFDLYRRLLIRFALELDTQEKILDERVRRHGETEQRWSFGRVVSVVANRLVSLVSPRPSIAIPAYCAVFVILSSLAPVGKGDNSDDKFSLYGRLVTGGTEAGEYSVVVTRRGEEEEARPCDIAVPRVQIKEEAIELNRRFDDEIGDAGAVGWRFGSTQGAVVSVMVSSDEFNLFVQLFSPAGQMVACDRDLDAHVVAYPVAGEEYTVVVTANGEDVPYEIAVLSPPPPPA